MALTRLEETDREEKEKAIFVSSLSLNDPIGENPARFVTGGRTCGTAYSGVLLEAKTPSHPYETNKYGQRAPRIAAQEGMPVGIQVFESDPRSVAFSGGDIVCALVSSNNETTVVILGGELGEHIPSGRIGELSRQYAKKLFSSGSTELESVWLDAHYMEPFHTHSYSGISGFLHHRQTLDQLIDRASKSRAQERLGKLTDLADELRKGKDRAAEADRVLRTFLSSNRSNRIDDATDLLFLTGPNLIRELVNRSKTVPQDGANDDYWYTLVVAAGRIGDPSLIEPFLNSRRLPIQEAVIQALGEIGDASAIDTLKSIAADSSRPRIIRELAEQMASDLG